MVFKLIKIGNSVGVTLPKKLLSLLNLQQGEEVFIETDLKNKAIIIKSLTTAKNEVNKDVVKGMEKFTKRYSKALHNLSQK